MTRLEWALPQPRPFIAWADLAGAVEAPRPIGNTGPAHITTVVVLGQPVLEGTNIDFGTFN